MNVAQRIERTIAGMQDGTVFKYQELDIAPTEYGAAAKAMERLKKKGIVDTTSSGVFYKPKKTVFGTLKPAEEELIKPYLYENNKRIAYITGTALYNRMGLTTQVPQNISVASREKRVITKIGNIQVRAVKSYADVSDDNYPLLEILDAIKDLKIIPDVNRNSAVQNLLGQLTGLTDKGKLVKLALKYPPRVRALTGALLEQLGLKDIAVPLQKSINPLSAYTYGISPDILPTLMNWNIL
ncbi:DUF6088 family protein [Mucilaginibacter sp. 10I4]|uniref:DUF6088 family protein n=1 Tax=Mucilaginibacter sp. 10I4 TaxID=3048580 RepID=UPI002B22CF1A|nr:DUF6088 family protein [Mucilaginibacter sp. 10I4]MEB0262054.1 DUF6088 family protein [Mucilaginibacter sp. 10I4]